jgi:hypothetical protein
MYPQHVNRLLGQNAKGESDAPPLTVDDLTQAFANRDPQKLPSAAFLIGRCQPSDSADQSKLTALVQEFVKSIKLDKLGIMTSAYIEAAMSLALRGEREQGHKALLPLVAGEHADESNGYLAAFYLAQMGDPSGYPAMRKALRHESEHTRLMAVRHLIAFKPYDGQSVQGTTVDVRAELAQRLNDHDTYVRVEVPYYLAEAQVSDLATLLASVAKNDKKKEVREAARDELDRLKSAH